MGSLEIAEFGRDDCEAVRARDEPSAPRQGRCEVDVRPEQTDRFHRGHGFAAAGTGAELATEQAFSKA